MDTQLQEFDEKQNIDMSLVIGRTMAAARTASIPDQSGIAGQKNFRLGRLRTMSSDLGSMALPTGPSQVSVL